MPAVPHVMAEKTPRMTVVLVLHEYANSTTCRTITSVGAGCHVSFPDDRQEERAGTVHDCYVRERPITIVAAEGFDDHEEERVAFDGAHCVIRDACWRRLTDP